MHAINLWKGISPKQYPNGAVVFCSDEFAEILHPPTPLRGRTYSCGRQFNTSVLEDAIQSQLGPVYGVIVIDGSDAAFGKVQGLNASMASGPVVSVLGSLDSHIAGRTRRGGQSALRFSRLREGSELAFLRKVAERAGMLLTDVSGIIVGGKADMKQKLVQELPEPLRKQVLCIVDLPCNASADALDLAARRAIDSVAECEHAGVDCVINRFFELTLRDSMSCYGEMQTLKAVEMGAVEHLLLASDLESTLLAKDGWKALAESYGTLVVEVYPTSEQGAEFCKSFGVGGCLRWPLDSEVLEEELVDAEEAPAEALGIQAKTEDKDNPVPSLEKTLECASGKAFLLESSGASAAADAEIERVSTSTTDTINVAHTAELRKETLEWFKAEVQHVLDDTSAAEAVTACVEVVLADEVTSMHEVSEDLIAMVVAEGLPEELALELMRRW